MRFLTTLLLAFAITPAITSALCAQIGYRQLKWSDYRGTPPDAGTDPAALTVTRLNPLTYRGTAEPAGAGKFKGTISGNATLQFIPESSWVRPGQQTPELLEHEQYHLDIDLFWARATNSKLRKICTSGSSRRAARRAALAAASEVMEDMEERCEAMHEAYDMATDHGRNADAQQQWCHLVGFLIRPWRSFFVSMRANARGVATPGSGSNGEDGSGKLEVPPTGTGSYESSAGTITDPVLGQFRWRLPPLTMQSYFMGATRARLFSLDGNRTVTLGDGVGQPVLTGELLHMMGDDAGTTYRGFISSVELDPGAVARSPFLGELQRGFAERRLVLLELSLPQSIETLTSGWRVTAEIPMTVRIGSAELVDAADVNLDGVVDEGDVEPFFQLLDGRYPDLFGWAGDINGDDIADERDIEPFLQRVMSGSR